MNRYFNQVILAISTMDIERLDLLLDSSIPYSDVPKEIFLKRLNEAFNSFKEEGDTFLISQPGSCCNFECNPESVRTAYRFVGNKTRLYLDLRFITEMTADRNDHQIKDIFSCYSFNCFKPMDWYANDISFCFYDDEKVDFQKSPELIIHMEKQKEAMKELGSYLPEITESELRSWLFRHQSTYDFFERYPKRGYYSWYFFSMRYNSLQNLIRFIERLTLPSFLEEIFKENDFSEKVLIQKIIQIEELLINYDQSYLIWIWKNEEEYFFREHRAFLKGGIFDKFAQLWEWFKPRHLELLQKYFALTPNETEEFCLNQKYYSSTDTIYTLSFHMDIRKKARSKGEYIPMGLWSDEQPMPFWSDNLNEIGKDSTEK
ncbi:hypothetical protein E4S40_10600 [Algoriphagus kandeliae]|uniref:Uncharacterized protein n=1 Tax=Algoriphagus kandeliae TaxID=2562278 RepID=A0A4Y9QS52_9BACT|nr:hypothetical protein [Algoriphagus kandeliae]TFV94462.1 hypothetical protein E4S40_10600 [Algoriphagus kandeliae]